MDGGRPGYTRMSRRERLRALSLLPLGLGYLWMLWDPQQQTWHDKICGTMVVRA